MSNIDTRWEQALLNKVTSNGERIAVMERDVKDIKDNSLAMREDMSNLDKRLSDIEKLIHEAKKLMKWILGGMGAVFLSLVANFIYAYLH